MRAFYFAEVVIKKIAVFFGHVASNIGDLAINVGELSLIQSTFPGAQVVFVALHIKEGLRFDKAKAEVAAIGDAEWTIFRTSFRHIVDYQASPGKFLQDCGVEDADLVLLASGEHLFSYEAQPNLRSLYWRTLPAFSAKSLGKPCVMLPSTFGPFESEAYKKWMAHFLSLLDGVAVRDERSLAYLRDEFHCDPALLPDPAFFLTPEVKHKREEGQDIQVLGLAMRAEDWGIRLAESKKKAGDIEESGAAHQAASFSISLIQAFFAAKPNGEVRVFVQTEADRALAEEVRKNLGLSSISVVEPSGISDYLKQLACVDALVASRFHAIILGLKVGLPVRGVYFPVHGHKMPGLFSWLGIESACYQIGQESDLASHVARDILSCRIDWQNVNERIEKECQTLIHWLKDQASACEVDLNKMFGASLALNTLGGELINAGFQQDKAAARDKLVEKFDREKEGLVREHSEKINFLDKELSTYREGFPSDKNVVLDHMETYYEKHPEKSLGLDFSLHMPHQKG